MLDRTATRLGCSQFDQVVVEEDFDVIADLAQPLDKLFRKVARTPRFVVHVGEDSDPQGMAQPLNEPLAQGLLPLVSHLICRLAFRLFLR
jgi:hypothetical protein